MNKTRRLLEPSQSDRSTINNLVLTFVFEVGIGELIWDTQLVSGKLLDDVEEIHIPQTHTHTHTHTHIGIDFQTNIRNYFLCMFIFADFVHQSSLFAQEIISYCIKQIISIFDI